MLGIVVVESIFPFLLRSGFDMLYFEFFSLCYLFETICSILDFYTKEHKITYTSIIVAGSYCLVIPLILFC